MNEREAKLLSEGWRRRFVAAPPRLAEITELYESLGSEVLLEPQPPEELDEECGACQVALELTRLVYTRAARSGQGS
jgi:hypothetical protein